MEGDKLFEIGTAKCNQCGHYSSIYLLAKAMEKAVTIFANSGGLCGDCMCRNIIDTHGMVVTDPDHLIPA